MKKLFAFLFSRMTYLAIVFLLQVALLALVYIRFEPYFVYFYGTSVLLSLVTVTAIVNSPINSAYKISWILVVLGLPVFGVLFYLAFRESRPSRTFREKLGASTTNYRRAVNLSTPVLSELLLDPETHAQARYLNDFGNAPLFKNTYTRYFSSGEEAYECLLEELKKARHFIFMEYFIIAEGLMWGEIVAILKEKAKEGLDVRLIYDDMGCLRTLKPPTARKLEEAGIRVTVFNPMKPILLPRHNNRDHRKIVVIDGETGFTGGFNLADEYINVIERFGYWKDTGIMMKGEAVSSLTVMFLSLWNAYHSHETLPMEQFLPAPDRTGEPVLGYVQPFTDNPLDNEPVGENVYMNMVNRAKKYVYIVTPYLIITGEMLTALMNGAKAGLDIRIITPHVPDKPAVHAVTRSYYEPLLRAGVRIYEYLPGFIHAKSYVSDDNKSVVGTINMDYRSLYLHFECGVFLFKTPTVLEVKEDFLETLRLSEEMTLDHPIVKANLPLRWWRSILRLFAPFL